jgi:ABC-type polysaccharide/polyol phosphate transport system ATPase subunit
MENIVIDVQNVTMKFKLSTQKIDSFKEFLVRKIKRKIQYKEFTALKSVSFHVMKGERLAIIGHNGAGKSTLLKAISGVMKPTEGSISINGTIAPLLELGAGFDPELSGFENIYLNGAVLGKSKKYIDERLEEIINFADLGDFLHVQVKNYSSGMRARLGFSIATQIEPDILIVDEILSVGDQAFRQKSLDRMYKLMSQGRTVLLVSHDLGQIQSLADRVLWLDKGEIKDIGKPDEIISKYREHMNSL